MIYKKYVKRMIDFLAAFFMLPIIVILIIIIGPLIYLEDHGTIVYKAKRRGLNGRVFDMYKFRSMKMNAPDIRNKDNSTFNSENDPRVTKIGKILRKTSIDETLQIINVLKGDMSLVGPRATIPIEGNSWSDLNKLQKKRLTVRPGITGYTAALYRNSISSEEKRKKDCYYADHVSFLLDIKILIWTVKTVLLRKNLYTNSGKSVVRKKG